MMWQRVALCVAGLGAITVSAALADDTTPIANQDAPQGAFVAYLDDDPPDAPDAQAPSAQAATAQAAGRVLRMLEILGVHRPPPMPAPVLATTDVPPPPASETPPLETAAPFAYQEDAGRSLYEANAPGDDDRFPLVAASPDSSEPNEDGASSWQINDLRDPARTRTDWLHDEGLRDRVGLETDAVASSGEANAGPARQLANSATPAPPIRCPDGTKSSRRTFQQADAGTNVAQVPAAEPPAVIAPAASEAPTAAAPADFDPSPRSALSMTSLPPLPPLRSDAPFLEPRSVDAVLAPRPVPIVKSPPAARDGADVELAKTSDNVEFKPTAMPSPKHRPSALPALELPPQRVAASRRQPSSVAGGPARGVMLSQLPNMLRDPPPARKTDLPRQIALQSSPQSQSRLAPLPPQSLPPQTLLPQTLLPLPAKLPSLQPPRTGDLAAAAEPALLRVAVRESRLLRTPENIVRVVSEQDNICDVLLFNPREIAVVGKQRGQAKVEFWYDGQGLNRVSYLVAVDDERAPDMQNRVDLPKIERLVAYLFPNSRVELIGDQGRLIIRGSATSQREAVEILSTVRRSQLIPVTDEIVVQPAAK